MTQQGMVKSVAERIKERRTALSNSSNRVQSPEPNLAVDRNYSVLGSLKKENTAMKAEKAQNDIEAKHASVEGDKEDEKTKTLEKEKNYEDCNDLVLVDYKDEEKVVATEEKSLSPDARDKLQATRPGTSPVVQRVPKSDYNKIG